MSTVKTYLTIVFVLEGDMIRATEYFGEQDVRRKLDDIGIQWPAERKEIHVSYLIKPPLSQKQLEHLTWMKEMGMCSNFYVKDEIIHEPSQQSLFEDPAKPKNIDQA